MAKTTVAKTSRSKKTAATEVVDSSKSKITTASVPETSLEGNAENITPAEKLANDVKKLQEDFKQLLNSIDDRFGYVPKADHNHQLEELDGWQAFIKKLLKKVSFDGHKHDFSLSDETIDDLKSKISDNFVSIDKINEIANSFTEKLNELAAKVEELPKTTSTGQTLPYLACGLIQDKSGTPLHARRTFNFVVNIKNPCGMCLYLANIRAEVKYCNESGYVITSVTPITTASTSIPISDPMDQLIESVRFTLESPLNSAYNFNQTVRVR